MVSTNLKRKGINMLKANLKNLRTTVFLITLIIWIGLGDYLLGQGTLSVDEIKKISQKSYSSQAASGVQGRLQNWFIHKVKQYQTAFNRYEIIKSGTVFFGNFSNLYKKILAPPYGKGNYYIYWTTVNAPKTEKGIASNSIYFPSNAIGQYGGPRLINTQWHEFQHAVMFDISVSPPISIWNRYTKDANDKAEDHPYMEGLGEYTWEWLEELLNKRKFENLIRKAYEEQKSYEKKGEIITYFIERGIWGEANEAWRVSWKHALKIAPMPQIYRDEYKKLTTIKKD